ncbi:MAG: helix-turn-helix domain-containing protein [Ruminococcus sp.]|nr:helix-turn-helix domain-containing protein [Ruminococcus sp.]
MYSVMLLMDNKKLERELRSLSVWGEASCFEITASTSKLSMEELSGCELIIAEKTMGLQLLRKAQLHRKQLRVVLCSYDKDFDSARQGMVLGAYDYITMPFDLPQIHSMLGRAESELRVDEVSDIIALEQIIEYFYERNDDFYSYFNTMLDRLLSGSEDMLRSAEKLGRLYENIWEELSERHQWFDLYISDGLFRLERPYTDREQFDSNASRIVSLFKEFCELYPHHSEQLEEVITTILNYPEGDLRQKTLAAQLHINSTYLSTVFLAQTGIRFVDFVNSVKLKRAAWLLINTTLGVTEIAIRLDYKDSSYFSKLFRQRYGVAPSLYRMPPSYDFQI